MKFRVREGTVECMGLVISANRDADGKKHGDGGSWTRLVSGEA